MPLLKPTSAALFGPETETETETEIEIETEEEKRRAEWGAPNKTSISNRQPILPVQARSLVVILRELDLA